MKMDKAQNWKTADSITLLLYYIVLLSKLNEQLVSEGECTLENMMKVNKQTNLEDK